MSTILVTISALQSMSSWVLSSWETTMEYTKVCMYSARDMVHKFFFSHLHVFAFSVTWTFCVCVCVFLCLFVFIVCLKPFRYKQYMVSSILDRISISSIIKNKNKRNRKTNKYKNTLKNVGSCGFQIYRGTFLCLFGLTQNSKVFVSTRWRWQYTYTVRQVLV